MICPKIFTTATRKALITCLLLFSTVLFYSCEKDHAFDFLKSTGKIITLNREVNENFVEIQLENNINLILTQDDHYEIRLEGGENLLPGIETSIRDSVLTLKNLNKFNWVRSYDKKITAYITAPHFFRIGYKSTGTVSNVDTIHEDSIFVTAYEGSGYINLCMNVGLSHLSINSGSADFNISGYSGSNFIYAGGYGPFHCLNLETLNTYMSNRGTNDCYVNVKNHLEYEIKGLGSIYYKGKPPQVMGVIAGEGKLVALE